MPLTLNGGGWCPPRPPSPPFEADIPCSRRDNEQMLSSFRPRERKCHCFLLRLGVCGSPECTLYGHFHPQTAAIIHSALLSSSDSGRIRSLLDNERSEKRAGGENCDGPPLTEAGISSASRNISRRGECDCLNTREKRGSRRKSGREQCRKSSFNIVRDKESEPHRLHLPVPFLPLQPGSAQLELLMSPCVPLQVRWEIRSEVLAVSAI